jgi:hypothetical protein
MNKAIEVTSPAVTKAAGHLSRQRHYASRRLLTCFAKASQVKTRPSRRAAS